MNSETELTENVEWCDNEIEASRIASIKEWLGKINDVSEEEIAHLKETYQNEIGKHEPIDRLYMLAYTFEEFVQTHPTVLLNYDLYEKAFKINEMMVDLYQNLSIEAINFIESKTNAE